MSQFVARTAETAEVNGATYKTRAWLMDPKVISVDAPREESARRHQAYYAQFNTPAVRNILKSRFSKAEIELLKKELTAGNTHFNSIPSLPLERWDSMSGSLKCAVASLMTRINYEQRPPNTVLWSLSDAVCVGKSVMRDMIEKELV